MLLTDALDHLALVEPRALREPVRMMLRAGIEQCAISSSLLGKPVGHVLMLAQALVDEGHSREDQPVSMGYVGPATLVTKDAAEVPVTAELERRADLPIEVFGDAGQRIHAATHGWRGSLKADESVSDYGPLPLLLRFPGGGEAELWKVSVHTSDPRRLQVTGYGDAPWRDR
ncbi:hypothetical protein ACGFNU_20975 [Spirillospora sp. NPDC048911]|uniref:hypothetical protein n=1 Tax=Spirillospora sp. NPDC048911 TaxID=3364527 RepID=UPI003718AF57